MHNKKKFPCFDDLIIPYIALKADAILYSVNEKLLSLPILFEYIKVVILYLMINIIDDKNAYETSIFRYGCKPCK